jgi:dTDP-glucose pyrophosphorylase
VEDHGAVGNRARLIIDVADAHPTPGSGRARHALVLARGAGSRMRADDDEAVLSAEQRHAAAAGHKALMPIAGRPFLDFVLSALAQAGVTDVALVVAPDHRAMRDAYAGDVGPGGVRLSWVVQSEPLGTANAVLAARDWAGTEPFLVLNGDNVYPVPALTAVCALDGPGLAGFERDNLVATSNIAADRIAAFALLDVTADHALERIVEKPSADEVARAGGGALVSMNLWRFDARIFDACRDVPASPRGEFELPSAAMLARERGMRLDVVRALGPVLDLSRRGDVADVARRLTQSGTTA